MSSSMTSTEVPSVIASHCSQTSHGVGVGPEAQLIALARIRAVEVLPGPARAGEQVGVGEPVLPDRVLSVRVTWS
jgi:hypothetical protein